MLPVEKCTKILEVNLSANCFIKISLQPSEQIQLAIFNHPYALYGIIWGGGLGFE